MSDRILINHKHNPQADTGYPLSLKTGIGQQWKNIPISICTATSVIM